MEYIAHLNEERIQTMKDHLCGTAELAGRFAGRFGKSDWGYACGMLHDIGKYSLAFQDKIKNNSDRRVDHSTAGAKACFEKGGMYSFMSYCIAGHHSGLPDYGISSDLGDAPTLQGRKRKHIEDCGAYKSEIHIPEIKTLPFDPQNSPDPDFSLSVFIRMLYSCLVDADFLDTEYFMKEGRTQRETGEEPSVLLEKLKKHVAGWLLNEDTETVNGRRTEILRHCFEWGHKERGIFQLTVPTGGGKTIASLAFALQHAVENQMDRVIYVIPYTSIIEQNAAVFRKILGEQNVLENHYNVDYESTEELKPMQLASENWDKPVVVTTNVQFFESLFANKSSKCRKLHNIANSVIIFDEAQMLPTDYLKPCIAVMEELAANFGSSIVLCTATQPALSPFFQRKMPVTELCPRVEEQFRFFERVTFQNVGTISEDELIEKLQKEEQAICIVNTKKRAQRLYQKMKGEGVFHLSTAMYPKHRRRVLDKIRRLVKDGKRCILISTSLVEAGVDLDFCTVYRQLAGVDSMIQAAGRCNREGKRAAQDSFAYLFQFEEKEYVPGQQLQIDVSKMLLSEGEDISSLHGIEKYFEALYHFRGESLDKKKIFEEFKDKRYNFAKAAKEFKLIEENTLTVFISREEEAEELLWQIKYQGYTKSGMRKAGQYCIQLYENDIEKLRGAGMLRQVPGGIENFYELVDSGQYSEEMGLDLGIESGIAVVM
ncbi:MAG TPA: CRISPR-associated helicase Cas3' [Candidatus Mediterraneibacter stercoravium]|uniref:CRISPR-associated helicase Cas3 n=1 Tax=Candidatus Mediterraneibacter stercoravium TaxID=2838685 RepID=A0A9D2K2Z0_9FIRM|nr:CRISPR-associated helicase Cas3' [Candidatus Mediterraneibacter stercoravium]